MLIKRLLMSVFIMAPVLYMTSLSPPSRGVLMTAEAIEIKLELIHLNLSKGEHRNLEYLKLNPHHTVPTLVDGKTILTDSHVINSYLVLKYGKSDDLYPQDCTKKALVDLKLYFDAERLFPLFRNGVAPIFYQKAKTVSQENIQKIMEGYKMLESFLGNSEWMAGDRVTIADISLMTTTTALNLLVPLNSTLFPKTVAWIERIDKLSWAKVNESGLNTLKEIINNLSQAS